MEKPEYVVLSVMGPHAGEDTDAIFIRKTEDVRRCGKTFWLVRSHLAKPNMVQKLCSEAIKQTCNPLCFFLKPSSPGGAVPTKSNCKASEYSSDFSTWHPLPPGLGPVTGRISPSAYALIFDELIVRESEIIDLWGYADFFDSQRPITIRQGASTVCAIGRETRTHPDRMKSHLRPAIAIGRLAYPYSVWLR
jgi:hypothetical protein